MVFSHFSLQLFFCYCPMTSPSICIVPKISVEGLDRSSAVFFILERGKKVQLLSVFYDSLYVSTYVPQKTRHSPFCSCHFCGASSLIFFIVQLSMNYGCCGLPRRILKP